MCCHHFGEAVGARGPWRRAGGSLTIGCSSAHSATGVPTRDQEDCHVDPGACHADRAGVLVVAVCLRRAVEGGGVPDNRPPENWVTIRPSRADFHQFIQALPARSQPAGRAIGPLTDEARTGTGSMAHGSRASTRPFRRPDRPSGRQRATARGRPRAAPDPFRVRTEKRPVTSTTPLTSTTLQRDREVAHFGNRLREMIAVDGFVLTCPAWSIRSEGGTACPSSLPRPAARSSKV
jgi:hypothetical protein